MPQQQAVSLANFKGLFVEAEGDDIIVAKLGHLTENWNASATSLHSIEGARCATVGISCVPKQADRLFVCGLASGVVSKISKLAGDQNHSSVDYAAFFNSNGNFLVVESGNQMGRFGTYAPGDCVEVALNSQGKIAYRVNNQVRYVSQKRPEYPLFVKICGCSKGTLLKQLCWVGQQSLDLSRAHAEDMAREQARMILAFAQARRQAELATDTASRLQAEKAAAVTAKESAEMQSLQSQAQARAAQEEKDVTLERLRDMAGEKVAEVESRTLAEGRVSQLLVQTKQERDIALERLRTLAAEKVEEVERRASAEGQVSQLLRRSKEAELRCQHLEERLRTLAAEKAEDMECRTSADGRVAQLLARSENAESSCQRLEVLAAQQERDMSLAHFHTPLTQNLDSNQDNQLMNCDLSDQRGILACSFPAVMYDGASQGEADMRFVKVQAVGVSKQDVEVEEINGRFIITIQRKASPGISEVKWEKQISFSDGCFQLQEEAMELDQGILLLPFRRKVSKRRSMRFSSRSHPCTGSESDVLPAPAHADVPIQKQPIPARSAKSSAASDVSDDFKLVHSVDDLRSAGGRSVDVESEASSQSVKCFLPNTAFPTTDGHLLLVQNLQVGARVKLCDQTESRVVSLKEYSPKKKQPYNLIELSTAQGSFRVSARHRVTVPQSDSCPDRAQYAEMLKVGDMVLVGAKLRELTKVTPIKARTELYMVGFDPDGPVEMFPVAKWGMQTWGEQKAEDQTVDQGEVPQVGSQLLSLVGIPEFSEGELLDAMPLEYKD